MVQNLEVRVAFVRDHSLDVDRHLAEPSERGDEAVASLAQEKACVSAAKAALLNMCDHLYGRKDAVVKRLRYLHDGLHDTPGPNSRPSLIALATRPRRSGLR